MNLLTPFLAATGVALFLTCPLGAQSTPTDVDSALHQAINGEEVVARAPMLAATWGDVLNAMINFDLRGMGTMVPPMAKSGDRDAQLLLGMMHRYGLGVDCDNDLYIKWIRRAANQGEPAAARILSTMLEAQNKEGEGMGQILMYKHIAEAVTPRLAIEWLSLDPNEERTNWGVAFQLNMDLALVNSDPTACYNLSQFYTVGLGTERNLPTGQVWLRKAAASGHGEALYEMARCFDANSSLVQSYQQMGMDLPEITNPAKATEYYEKSAQAGYLKALLLVARAYENGRGVEKNPDKAFTYYKAAAEQEDPLAAGQLAWCYDTGFGTKEDKALALQWYRTAIKYGNSWAWGRLGVLYEMGVKMKPNLAEAIRCYKRGAMEGDAFSQRKYGLALGSGQGVPVDITESTFWYSRAAAQQDNFSEFLLAQAYYFGRGTDADWAKAANLFERAAESGINYAWYYLGTIYKVGHPTLKADPRRSAIFYKRGSEAGEESCLVAAGIDAINGDGTPVDSVMGFRLLEKATAKNSAHAFMAMAYALVIRDGDKVDEAELRKNLTKAGSFGGGRAELILKFAQISPLPLHVLVKQMLKPYFEYGNADWTKLNAVIEKGVSTLADYPPQAAFSVSPFVPVTMSPSGSVTLLMSVNEQGQVSDVVVEKSTEPLLESYCIEAARQWLFAPGRKANQPSTFKVRQTFDFAKFTRRSPDSGSEGM